MRYRTLGRTGIRVSEIGFGTWGLGGDSYGPVQDSESRLALRQALDAGVTFYDTSDLYGGGHSEEVLGQTFRADRSKIIIATKVGLLPHTGFYMPSDFSAAKILSGVEASLSRLQTDYIDLYQLHSPQLDLPNWDEIVDALRRLRDAGKIRAFGLSARSPADALTAIERLGFDVVQVNFNLIDQRAIDNGLLARCAADNVGVISRTPLCFGYLSGTLTGEEVFEKGDHRANWPREQLRRWAKAPELFAPLNEGTERNLMHLALLFCLAPDAVSVVIPGMLTRDQVTEDLAVVDMPPLSADELSRVREIFRSHVFYDPAAKSQSPTSAPPAPQPPRPA